MRTLSRISVLHPTRHTFRVLNVWLFVGTFGLACAIAAWQGTPLPVVVPTAVIVIGTVLFLTARRALRHAGTRIDTILREELGPRG